MTGILEGKFITDSSITEDKLSNEIIEKLNDDTPTIEIVQTIGSSTDTVMSQKAVTDELNKKTDPSELENYIQTSISIPADSDLNDYIKTGFYRCFPNSTSATISNRPSASIEYSFSLLVEETTASGCTQKLTEHSPIRQNIYVRNHYNGNWSEWKRITLDSDLESALNNYVPTTRKVNGKSLNSDITLTASDLGAASTSDLNNYLPKTGGTLTGTLYMNANNINLGASTQDVKLGYTTATGIYLGGPVSEGITIETTEITSNSNIRLNTSTGKALYNGNEIAIVNDIPTDYVPTTRKVNGKTLDADITLTASEIGAASTSELNSKLNFSDVYANSNKTSIVIGNNSSSANNYGIAIGSRVNVSTPNTDCIAIGNGSRVEAEDITEDESNGKVPGPVSFGRSDENIAKRRLINIADGVNDNDAATVGQLNSKTGILYSAYTTIGTIGSSFTFTVEDTLCTLGIAVVGSTNFATYIYRTNNSIYTLVDSFCRYSYGSTRNDSSSYQTGLTITTSTTAPIVLAQPNATYCDMDIIFHIYTNINRTTFKSYRMRITCPNSVSGNTNAWVIIEKLS